MGKYIKFALRRKLKKKKVKMSKSGAYQSFFFFDFFVKFSYETFPEKFFFSFKFILGPSPLTLGMSDVVPIAVAFQEVCHAMFNGSEESRCQTRLIGK